jgi:putative RecB family exonuclease
MTTLCFDPEAARAPPKLLKQERDYLSFSAIRTYQQCPLRYFFRYIAGLPEQTISASLVFGSAIHHAVEHHFRRLLEGEPAPSREELLAAYSEGFAEGTAPIRYGKDDDADSLRGLADRMLTAFSQSKLAKPSGRILAVEETLRGSIFPGLPDLLGRVDLIVETPNELVVSDWKTSRARYSQDQVEDSSEQLLLYSELAKDFAPGKSLKLEFAVLTKTKEIQIDTHTVASSPGRVTRINRIVERVWRSIEAQHFYPAPSQMNCGGCPFRNPCQSWPG